MEILYTNILFSRNSTYIHSKNTSPTPAPTPILITIDLVMQKLRQDILTLQNKIAQTETEDDNNNNDDNLGSNMGKELSFYGFLLTSGF
ncbi:hypothetical protein Glove_375g18 [Diversispora epigaea]|uniref:Uncharacterized protein n=1 Tax=Diversispora epigaea TaxID=1348612 RepID=A0A397H911_9GLOM|nr:hypothetical protein Glove_375g18 [Diversispora epigaea]